MNTSLNDHHQRHLALDTTQSFIVQAPAGSGKTELLIQRLLVLLTKVNKPEEILSITFTKRAANEMRMRVIKALNYADSHPAPESAHHKQTWELAKKVLARDALLKWNLLNNPNQLRIQTIDSLCAYLTKQLPLLSHFGSQPDIALQPERLYREAVQEVLLHVENDFAWSKDIAKLLLHFDNDLNRLHDLLISLLAKRDQWLAYIQLHSQDYDVKKQLETHLTSVISTALTAVKELFPEEIVPELLAVMRFAADNLVAIGSDSEIVACRNLTDLPKTNTNALIEWRGLTKLLLTKSFSWRKRMDAEIGFPAIKNIKNSQEKILHTEFRQRLTQIIAVLNDNENLRKALSELFFLPASSYQSEQWDILQTLLHVLKIVVAQLRVTFQQHGQIDFIENVQAALLALGTEENPTDLALSLDYQIQHILVDEFQDTSFVQYQLLEKLTIGWQPHDGRTLFVVGDPMQSIYRFREAEVGLFLKMHAKGLGHLHLQPLLLTLNFRSAKKIVDWNNKHYQSLFPQTNDIATGAVIYSKSISHKNDENSTIEMNGFVNSDAVVQAEAIVNLIIKLRQQQPHEKIAILVRSRTHLTEIIPAIKKAKLGFRAVDINPLASRQCIQDLLSLTCALLHPADRIAWLAVLRAPWCGLTLNDLFHLAGENPHITIYEQLERTEILQRLTEDGQARVNRVFPHLKRSINERERANLRYWVENTWLLLGGPACLHDLTDIDDVNEFFCLLDNFSHSMQFNLDLLKEKIQQLYSSKFHEDDSLQIMTIHAAKGLEFDTVILPHLERKNPSDSKALLSWMEQPLKNDQVALLIAPIHAFGENKDSIYEYIQRQQKIKNDFETDRLLYVATTRAKKSLYLFFNASQNEDGKMKTEPGSFLEKLWNYCSHECTLHHALSENPEASNTELPPPKKYLQRLSTSWKNPLQPPSTSTSGLHQKLSGFQLTDINPIAMGIVTHKILQKISQCGWEWWQKKKSQTDYLHYHLKQLGVAQNLLAETSEIVLKSIVNTLNDERGRWILAAHDDARAEFALTADINGEIKNIIIDRTFIDSAGIRWVIDYKTTTFSTDDLELFLMKEQEKYKKQMSIYAQGLQRMSPHPIRLGLYFPALPAWKEWAF